MSANAKDMPSASAAGAGDKPNATASRGILAAGFAWIGLKVGTIGTVIDAAKAFKGESLTFGEKMRQTFDGTLIKKLWAEVKKPETTMERVKTGSKILKYTIIFNAAGVLGGAALGWARGDRIENPKDLFLHPLKSLKLAFSKRPETDAPSQPEVQMASTATEASPAKPDDASKRWTDVVSQAQPMQTAEALPGR